MFIGELARLSGLSVRTLRYYADEGLVPEVARTPSGYREFGPEALARARFIKTLRELGVGLADVRRVLADELDLTKVAERHVRALEAQIRHLRLQRTLLATLTHVSSLEEVLAVSDYAILSAEERRRVVEDYLDAVFGDAKSPVAERLRLGAPELPEDPTPEQVAAWVEAARLLRDPDFVAASRRMVERAADGPSLEERLAEGRAVEERVRSARRAGVEPTSLGARAVVEAVEAAAPRADEGRSAAAERIEAFTDRRVARYWELVGVVNGWVPSRSPSEVTEDWAWYAKALRAHAEKRSS